MINLIGLHGHSRCGKDTVAGILVELYGYEQRVMADPIRKILLAIDPYVPDIEPMLLSRAVETWGWDGVKKHFPDTVEWMIRLGQSARDLIDEDIWLRPVLRDLQARTVISDVRQMNEAAAIRQLGGHLWKVVRPGTTPRGMDSLLEKVEFDCVIHNNGSLTDLEEAVRYAYEGTVGLEAD